MTALSAILSLVTVAFERVVVIPAVPLPVTAPVSVIVWSPVLVPLEVPECVPLNVPF